MGIKIRAGICSSSGRCNETNEDNFLFDGWYLNQELLKEKVNMGAKSDLPSLFAVCDGMGGIQNGARASLLVVEKLLEKVPYLMEEDEADRKKKLEEVIQYCNSSLCEAIKREGKMGSTLGLIYISGQAVWAANIGDSRIYKLHKDQLTQLSVDHNLAGELSGMGMMDDEQILKRRGSHQLTQYLGIHPLEMIIEPHYQCLEHEKGRTVYLICSDGINEKLKDEEIKGILMRYKKPKRASFELVKAAMNNSSKDNVTAIVIEIMKDEIKRWMIRS